MDPGGYRASRSMAMSCARNAVAWAGVADEVELTDDLTSTAQVELPVGFVFLDDGKIRFSNDPLMTLLEQKFMDGATVAMHDAYQAEPDSPVSIDHAGQAALAEELVRGGMFTPLVLPRHPVRGLPTRKVAQYLGPRATRNGDPFEHFHRPHHVVVVQRIARSQPTWNDTISIRAEPLRSKAEGTYSELSIELPNT